MKEEPESAAPPPTVESPYFPKKGERYRVTEVCAPYTHQGDGEPFRVGEEFELTQPCYHSDLGKSGDTAGAWCVSKKDASGKSRHGWCRVEPAPSSAPEFKVKVGDWCDGENVFTGVCVRGWFVRYGKSAEAFSSKNEKPIDIETALLDTGPLHIHVARSSLRPSAPDAPTANPPCKRCGKPVAHPAQEYCGAACSAQRNEPVTEPELSDPWGIPKQAEAKSSGAPTCLYCPQELPLGRATTCGDCEAAMDNGGFSELAHQDSLDTRIAATRAAVPKAGRDWTAWVSTRHAK